MVGVHARGELFVGATFRRASRSSARCARAPTFPRRGADSRGRGESGRMWRRRRSRRTTARTRRRTPPTGGSVSCCDGAAVPHRRADVREAARSPLSRGPGTAHRPPRRGGGDTRGDPGRGATRCRGRPSGSRRRRRRSCSSRSSQSSGATSSSRLTGRRRALVPRAPARCSSSPRPVRAPSGTAARR